MFKPPQTQATNQLRAPISFLTHTFIPDCHSMKMQRPRFSSDYAHPLHLTPSLGLELYVGNTQLISIIPKVGFSCGNLSNWQPDIAAMTRMKCLVCFHSSRKVTSADRSQGPHEILLGDFGALRRPEVCFEHCMSQHSSSSTLSLSSSNIECSHCSSANMRPLENDCLLIFLLPFCRRA